MALASQLGVALVKPADGLDRPNPEFPYLTPAHHHLLQVQPVIHDSPILVPPAYGPRMIALPYAD